MPDPIQTLMAVVVALAATAVPWMLAARWLSPPLRIAAQAVALALGLCLGGWLGGVRPHWPPREDQDRWLLLIVPAALATELIVSGLKLRPAGAWLLRGLLAAAVCPVLLYGSVYMSPAGSGAGAWTKLQMALVLGGAALLFCVGRYQLSALADRLPPHAVGFSLGMACAAAALMVLLSGYASAGIDGTVLAAVLGGGWLGQFAARRDDASRCDGWNLLWSLGVVALGGLLIVGRFFGELPTAMGLMAWFAPSALWLALIPVRRPAQAGRIALALVLSTVISAAGVGVAVNRFARDYAAPSGSEGPTSDEYDAYK